MRLFNQQQIKSEYFRNQKEFNTVVYNYKKSEICEIVKCSKSFKKNTSGIIEKVEKNYRSIESQKEGKRFSSSVSRTRRNIRRYLLANPDLSRFVTLTYKENLTDRDKALNDFKKFILRLRYRFPHLKYIAVTEYQKRGAIHFHIIINMFIQKEKLEKIWGLGFVDIKLIRNNKEAMNYVRKYITKESINLAEKNIYTRSRNLEIAEKEYLIVENIEKLICFLDLKNVEIIEYNINNIKIEQVFGQVSGKT